MPEVEDDYMLDRDPRRCRTRIEVQRVFSLDLPLENALNHPFAFCFLYRGFATLLTMNWRDPALYLV